MSEDARTWHHGLVARWWAEFNVGGPEVAYFTKVARRFGGPVLDAGCGTGRVLLPLLRAGLDADGSDVSADMLAFCRDKAAAEDRRPRLFFDFGSCRLLPGQIGGGRRACVSGRFDRLSGRFSGGILLIFGERGIRRNGGMFRHGLSFRRCGCCRGFGRR